jgi:hypothetical protein
MLRLVLAAVLMLCTCYDIAAYDRPVKDRDTNPSVGDRVRQVLPASEILFSVQERTIVRDWFRTRRSGLPPGLATRDRLPPGLEKQLRKRGSLPPGLQKKIIPLPGDLERRMRVLPTGYRRVLIAGNVVLMNEKTSLIYDIVRDVIP